MTAKTTPPEDESDPRRDEREKPVTREKPATHDAPLDAGPLEWKPEFRSMMDHPSHPLHHLKDAL